jgi:hypothetical protein
MAVLAWAALLVAIVMSFRPAVPVIWGDTPPFLESALPSSGGGKIDRPLEYSGSQQAIT